MLLSCNHSHTSEVTSEAITYYANGNRKDSINLNKSGTKEGKCFYFGEDGSLDSTVTFKNDKRNGLTSKFYGEYGTYTYEYKEDQLIEQKNYDTSNMLIYKSPLDITSLPKTTYRLKSNRTYFDQDLGDTIFFINPKLPPFNRGIEIRGAYFLSKANEYNVKAIRVSKRSNALKNIMIKINIYNSIGDSLTIPDRIDSLIIPVN